MAEFKFLTASRIRANEMITDTRSYVARLYGRTGELFSTASPFSQILDVLAEITKLIFFYVEDSTVEQNILTAQNPESVYGLARLAGHDAFRGSSAYGEIRIRLNTTAASDIAGDALNISRNSIIKCTSNGLEYILKTNNDIFRIDKSDNNYISIPVIQGSSEKQTVTATGEKLQSFNILTRKTTDHHSVRVSVNSVLWTKYDSLYDMKVGTAGYLVKTGINGGLDIYFGNGSFGKIPATGSSIDIEYLNTDGSKGNLTGSKDLTFKFVSDGFDSLGESYDLNQLLESAFTVTPKMGSDPESTELTKLIAPLQSHSFVLANPNSFEHFLSRYGMFSYLDAYNTTDDGYIDDDNVIYLFMLPDTARKLTKNKDYFSLGLDEFFFSSDEKNGFLELLENSGQQMVTTEVKIVDPKVQYFSMDVKVRYFEGYNRQALYSEIRSKISKYLINITRRDRLPKSDIIAILESVEGIDSVNVRFISKTEEDARRLGYYILEKVIVTPSTPVLETIGNGKQKYVFFKRTVTERKISFEPNAALPEDVINIDSFGDILLGKEEVALFRGGWLDRDGIEMPDDAKLGEQGALSIYFDDKPAPNTIFSKIQAKNRKAL